MSGSVRVYDWARRSTSCFPLEGPHSSRCVRVHGGSRHGLSRAARGRAGHDGNRARRGDGHDARRAQPRERGPPVQGAARRRHRSYLTEATRSATKTATPLSVTVATQACSCDQGFQTIEEAVHEMPGIIPHLGDDDRDDLPIRITTGRPTHRHPAIRSLGIKPVVLRD
jgi:hypothetical protein